ncbi:MAG: plasmid replication, integration and excision activator [Micrococcales bacterium]|nr:plasmid replication, integration and excision activator [Micrococcales bacterium]
MAMQRRIRVDHHEVFPQGAYLKDVAPVQDFEASRARADGVRVQAKDVAKDGSGTGMPLWACTVLDADEDAGRKEAVVVVKVAAAHQPVPPKNTSGFPWVPVEFVGLTATPYVDDNGNRPRLAWSLRASGMVEPGKSGSEQKAQVA